ncbi:MULTISPECIES: histidine--tRNA ligase [unclassified Desulfovibrio]|uniref:histidine--tRNA ligase n=1 Tax=unclassified Desulfovibrio TaxID=2593640 RepID=UPI0013ED94BD|nr:MULTISPECIES: histidine--tRNA ligase [unclassified Desulfovibrio]
MSEGRDISRIKGFADLFPPESTAFTRMEACGREIFGRYGFAELRTPLLEFTGLFQRSIGAETDVVQKEMYTFPDRKGRSMTLRPEATAGVMRACIEAGLADGRSGGPHRFFTMGPMFRYERPQKGRMRQFHQINCECLGTESPFADAELIAMLWRFLRELGIRDLTLKLNSLGCAKCRPAYMEALREYLANVDETALCEDCRRRRESNPLRVLDCKHEGCRTLTEGAPRLIDHNCQECGNHYDTVLQLLSKEGIKPQIDHRLVRGLDYYCRTTFEVVSNHIGAQTAVAGGGRYDGLTAQLGGPDAPGVGFACGMERLALLLPDAEPAVPDCFLMAPGKTGREQCFSLAEALRKEGLACVLEYSGGTFKSLMRKAAKSGARYCCIIGPDEAAEGRVTLRNMENGEQATLPQAKAPARLADLCAQTPSSPNNNG